MTEYKLVVIGSAGVGKGLGNKKKYINHVTFISFSNGPLFIFINQLSCISSFQKKERPHHTAPSEFFYFRVRAHHRGRLQGTGISEHYTYIDCIELYCILFYKSHNNS